MATPVIQPSFAAGELSPSLFGRVDLSKYKTGASVARNFFVDYRGGLSTRPGTQLVGTCIPGQTGSPRLLPFQFSTTQTYVIELNNFFLRIITNGGYILESGFSITAGANASPLTITAPSHNYSVGNQVVVSGVVGLTRPNGISGINGRTFTISAISGNILTLENPLTLAAVNASTWTAWTSGGTVSRIYTVTTPWAVADLRALTYAQSADVLTVAHPNYQTYNINRIGTTNWTVTALSIGTSLSPPTGQTATAGSNNPSDFEFFYPYTVTIVNPLTNEESNQGTGCACINNALNQDTGICNVITWAAPAGAPANAVYNVYKANPMPNGSEGSGPFFYGLMAQTSGLTVTDLNYTPDFTTNPPSNQNPFSGSNYPGCVSYFLQRRVFAASVADPDTFWMSKPGLYNNFDTTYPSASGDAITGTIVGQEVNAIVSLTPMASGLIALSSNGAYQISGGSVGAAITPSTIQAQPQAFSGAAALPPLRVEYDLLYMQARGSAVRDLSYNFYVNIYTGQDVSALSSHLFESRTVLEWCWAQEPFKLAWMVRDDGIALSFTYLKEQDLYGWARHDTCGLFTSVCSVAEGVQDAVYFVVNRYINGSWYYCTERLTQRFMGGDNGLNIPSTSLDAWCVDCGVQLPLNYPAASISGATQQTQGQIGTGYVVEGGSGYTNGTQTVIIQDPTGVGASMSVTVTNGAVTAVNLVSAGSGYTNPTFTVLGGGTGGVVSAPVINPWLITASASVFSSASVGQVMRVNGGVGVCTSYVSGTQIVVNFTTPIAGLLPNAPVPTLPIVTSGNWSLTTPQTVVGGLDHLTGATVSILADGCALAPQVVVDGCITLPNAASTIVAGLGYTCQMRTLRLELGEPTVQGKRKDVSSVTLRVRDSRGMEVGPDFKDLFEVKERDHEIMGSPINFQNLGGNITNMINGLQNSVPYSYDDQRINIANDWTREGVICVQQSYPLPCTILAVIPEVTIGDTPQ